MLAECLNEIFNPSELPNIPSKYSVISVKSTSKGNEYAVYDGKSVAIARINDGEVKAGDEISALIEGFNILSTTKALKRPKVHFILSGVKVLGRAGVELEKVSSKIYKNVSNGETYPALTRIPRDIHDMVDIRMGGDQEDTQSPEFPDPDADYQDSIDVDEEDDNAIMPEPFPEKPFFRGAAGRLVCLYNCGLTFVTKSSMMKHLAEHPEHKYICESCHQECDTYESLVIHTASHNRRTNVQCPSCDKVFPTESRLKTHLVSHSDTRNFECSVCQKRFKQPGALMVHMRTHTGEKLHNCEVCGSSFGTQTSLRRHSRIHTGEKPFQCEDCGRGFTQSGHLRTHQLMHAEEKPHKCSICNKAFRQLGTKREHELTHKPDENLPTCDICEKRFTTKSNMRRHMLTHNDGKPFKCEECGAGFTQSSGLKSHMLIHSGDLPYRCDTCGKRFRQLGTLRNHVKRLHPEVALEVDDRSDPQEIKESHLVCPHCIEVYYTQPKLEEHQRQHYICEFCEEKHDDEDKLKAHSEKKHVNLAYECPLCATSVYGKHFLEAHLKSNHQKQPKDCSVCGTKFVASEPIVDHLNAHISNYKYLKICGTCSRVFSNEDLLKQHNITAHSNLGDVSSATVASASPVSGADEEDGRPRKVPRT